MQYENEARVYFSAKSENESFGRLFAAGFLAQLDLTIAEMTDIKTAVSEAVTNAIIHGYETEAGLVELFCAYDKTRIVVEIADTGKGIENITLAREPLYTSKPEMERSGMGFTIMESFMDIVGVESAVGKGTRIHMEKMLIRE
ncbi:MAG: anti-sigma F factor [Anaerotignum sp.]|nr:anti-sigma F factor [Anaerotignum sp.]MBR3993292.1 anti-sigma F factor [Anaerotignum sp.]